MPVLHIIDKVAVVACALGPVHHAFSVSHVILPLPLVGRLVPIEHETLPHLFIVAPRAGIFGAGGPLQTAFPVHLVIEEVAFVHACSVFPGKLAAAGTGIIPPGAFVLGAISILHAAIPMPSVVVKLASIYGA